MRVRPVLDVNINVVERSRLIKTGDQHGSDR